MFGYLKGQVAHASTKSYTPISQIIQQFLTLTLVLAPFGGSIYALIRLINGQVTPLDFILLGGFYVATALGITVGFHRMLTHNSFEAHPIVKIILLIFGTWAIQGAALSWTAIHQKHHVKSDEIDDPHSPRRNFFHAHMGWLFGFERADSNVYAKSQQRDPIVRFISKTSFWWIALSFIIPFLIGGWSGFVWGVGVRLFLVHHVTWSVNSVCHVLGRRPYATGDLSTNNWIIGLLAMGEGWHNNHHAFPRSAFHGLRLWQIDTSGYVIHILGWLRLAKKIYRVPKNLVSSRLTTV